uniref:Uncharacterized protein n=1 Tax=Anguilla anguilla TaxID=7936 RepID=A0A0E9X9I9_ANGAN
MSLARNLPVPPRTGLHRAAFLEQGAKTLFFFACICTVISKIGLQNIFIFNILEDKQLLSLCNTLDCK